jgi:hypothetical protein
MLRRCTRRWFDARCKQAGLADCAQYISQDDGVTVLADLSAFAAPPSGPGAELKALLKSLGFVASPTCGCNKMAAKMDAWGPDDALAHMEEIVDVMEATAKARKLPFLRAGARQMVRLACWKARRKARRGH